MTLTTEGRIFTKNYLRDLRRQEATHAARLAPGTTNWDDAMTAFAERMRRAGSPGKQAKMVAAANLKVPGPYMLLGQSAGSRAAALIFITYAAGSHPFVGLEDEEGCNIMCHTVTCNRHGYAKLRSDSLAFVNHHAVGRLHERGDATPEAVTAVMGWCGLVGYLTRYSEKHFESGMHLHLGDTLLAGSLKYSKYLTTEGIVAADQINGMWDVRTALPIAEECNQANVDQGLAAMRAVREWTKTRDHSLVAQIPYLPPREDYVTRTAVRALEKENHNV